MVDLSDTSEARIDRDDVLSGGFETWLSGEELDPHISQAHDFVEDRLGDKLPEKRLARIEVFIARHLIRIGPDRQVVRESIGPVSAEFSGDFDKEELASTAPGQQAMMLDSTDTLGRQTINFFSMNG